MQLNLNFVVGQVIYLLSRKDPKVYPALVCEEIKKKSLTGESINYMIRLPTEDLKEVELDRLDVEIFTSIASAKKAMIEKATSQINFILESAKEASNIFEEFKVPDLLTEDLDTNKVESISTQTENDIDSEYATVDLGDGKMGRIKIDDVNQMSEVLSG